MFLYCGGHHDSDRIAVLVWSPRLKLLYCKYHQFMYTLPNKDFLPSFLPSSSSVGSLFLHYRCRFFLTSIVRPDVNQYGPPVPLLMMYPTLSAPGKYTTKSASLLSIASSIPNYGVYQINHWIFLDSYLIQCGIYKSVLLALRQHDRLNLHAGKYIILIKIKGLGFRSIFIHYKLHYTKLSIFEITLQRRGWLVPDLRLGTLGTCPGASTRKGRHKSRH